jgi:hypothetical protein
MVKRISLFVTIFIVCIFAEDIVETKRVVAETTPVAGTEPVQTEQVTTETTPAGEAEPVQTEQVATEATPIAQPPIVVATPAPAAANESAKEAIIDNPLEFAIVTAVFIATVLLITLTGN